MSASPLSRLGLPADDGEAPSGNRRKTVLGLGALGAVGAVLAATSLLAAGDELDDLGTPPAAAAVVPAASASPSPTPSLLLPGTGGVRDSRNPFAALYVAPTPVPQPVAAAPLAPVPAAPSAVAVPPAPGTAGGTGGVQPPADQPAPVRALALLRVVGADPAWTAVFTLDGAEQQVEVGESFGPAADLLLLSLWQAPEDGVWTAVVQVGQGEPFDVVTGAPVLVA